MQDVLGCKILHQWIPGSPDAVSSFPKIVARMPPLNVRPK
jgi:hypothetical protein